MRASTALALFSAVGASAQSAQNYSSELDMRIDTNKVPMEDRAVWCRAQTDTCGLLCDKNTDKNSCVPDTLKFECTCASNKSIPGLQFYVQTVPTFICNELFKQCTLDNTGKADEQKGCDTKIRALCGKSPPPKGPISSSDSGDSESSTSASSPTAQRTSGSVSSSSSGGLAAPTKAPAGNGAAAFAALGMLAYFI